MIHVGARPLQPACRWQMALFRNHTYTHTYIYTHTHTGIHTYINHAHGECPDVRNHTTDTCGYNITVCPASTWMSQTVNVLHVLCVLCTRICAWIYVYICISARKRSVLISIARTSRVGAAEDVGQHAWPGGSCWAHEEGPGGKRRKKERAGSTAPAPESYFTFGSQLSTTVA